MVVADLWYVLIAAGIATLGWLLKRANESMIDDRIKAPLEDLHSCLDKGFSAVGRRLDHQDVVLADTREKVARLEGAQDLRVTTHIQRAR